MPCPLVRIASIREHTRMTKDEHLERHLKLCQRVYERMKRDGTWLWSDEAESPNAEGVVESEGNTNNA